MSDSATSSVNAAAGTAEQPGEGFWQIEAGDVRAVEKALVGLRRQYASAEAVQEGQAGTRTSVANLVVYAGTDEDAARATAALEQLAGRHPARTILLVADLAPGEPSVRAGVSARCSIARGQQRICYEEIRLVARGRSAPHLRSVIDPLLITDLPTFLWWTGEPALGDEVFLALARLCDWVLVDSAASRSPAVTLTRLGRLVEDGSLEAALGDLNWDRLSMWRQTLAELFDPPAMTALLPRVRRVRIEVAAGPSADPASAQALLLLSWLAALLDWEPGRQAERTFSGAVRFRLRCSGRDVQADLRTTPEPNAVAGEVQSIAVEADDGARPARIEVARSPGREHARTSVTVAGIPPAGSAEDQSADAGSNRSGGSGDHSTDTRERVMRFHIGDDAMLLGQEIEDLERDRVYEEAVAMAGRLATLLPVEHGADTG